MTSEAQTLLTHMMTAVLVVDNALNVVFANPATEQLFGVSRRKLQAEPLPNLLQYSSLDFALLSHNTQQGQSLSDSDVSLLVAGNSLHVELSASPILWQQQRSMLLEIKPIDQKQAITHEWQQDMQQQAAKTLIRNLAHEIKNPLGGIRGAAQLLEQQLPAENTDFTQLIIEQTDRLKNLVDRLLGPQRLGEKQLHNIHTVLEKVRRLTEIAHSQITLVRDYDPSLPELFIDAEQIEQALLNVLNNAAQALSKQQHGQIILRTRTEFQVLINGQRHRLAARIDIMDNGAGIDEALLDTLFYPTVSGRADGSGLGLAITRNLLSQHQGKISASCADGMTTFTILLPITR